MTCGREIFRYVDIKYGLTDMKLKVIGGVFKSVGNQLVNGSIGRKLNMILDVQSTGRRLKIFTWLRIGLSRKLKLWSEMFRVRVTP